MSGPNELLRLLALFGNTGGEDVLRSIFAAVQTMQKFGTVHQSLAIKVRTKLIRFIGDQNKQNLRPVAWSCLTSLCSDYYNHDAERFLFILQDTNLLALIKLGPQHGLVANERNVIASFLSIYAQNSAIRCHKILDQAGLLQDLLSIVESFDPDNSSEWVSVSETLKTLTCLFEFSSLPLKILALGGRTILDAALNKLAMLCRTRLGAADDDIISVLEICALAYIACCEIFASKADQLKEAWARDKLPANCFIYSKEQALTVMQSWYYMLRYYMRGGKESKKKFILSHTLKVLLVCSSYCDYQVEDRSELVYLEGVMLQDAFQFSGAMQLDGELPNAEAPTLIRFVMQIAKELQPDIISIFVPPLRKHPVLLELVEEQVGKLIFCAQPDCKVSNFLRRQLKKCERCMSVWYCGREHQVAHWKAGHKQNCQRREERINSAAAAVTAECAAAAAAAAAAVTAECAAAAAVTAECAAADDT